MTTTISEGRVKRLCNYSIASADMYYSALEQRDVYVRESPQEGLRLWGETPSGGPATSVDLCQVLLEYAMYCRSWCGMPEASYRMKNFGERLGHDLAIFLEESTPVRLADNPGVCALEAVVEAMNAYLVIERVGPELHFIIADCALYEAAERTGLRNVELAQLGLNALCQSLIHTIDPHLVLTAPTEIHPRPFFSVLAP
ncbi:MAG: hypothetical protein FJ010_06590 [Chloroflexi bacterium]|nr:hypothetical protein [Chloroflexota bacterium]